MAGSRPSMLKRRREQARRMKKQRKASQRAERAAAKQQDRPSAEDPDYDPDIAHIVPGPQPKPWDDDELDEDTDAGDSNSAVAGQNLDA